MDMGFRKFIVYGNPFSSHEESQMMRNIDEDIAYFREKIGPRINEDTSLRLKVYEKHGFFDVERDFDSRCRTFSVFSYLGGVCIGMDSLLSANPKEALLGVTLLAAGYVLSFLTNYKSSSPGQWHAE